MYSTFYHWIHTRSKTGYELALKLFLAVCIYALIWRCIDIIFEKIESFFEDKGADRRTVKLITKPIEYSLTTFVLALIIVQWVLVETVHIIDRIKVLTWSEIRIWLHGQSGTVYDYVLKVIFALSIYILVSEILSRSARLITKKLSGVEFSQKLIRVSANIVRCVIQLLVVFISVIQLFIVEYNMVAAFVVLGLLLLAIAVKFRKFSFRRFIDGLGIKDVELVSDSKMSKAMRAFYSIIYRIVGVVIIFFILFSINRGINYLTGYGGEDVSRVLSLSEYDISKKLDTSFNENDYLVKKMPHLNEAEVKVHTDGDLNIIYVNGRQLGVNTTGRKYCIYGVSINEPEYEALKSMTYRYEGCTQTLDNISRGNVNTYYYYSKVHNDCLVLSVSKNSNRVVSVTYFTDYDMISKMINITDE